VVTATHSLDFQTLETPYLMINLNQVADKFLRLAQALPTASIFYAVKANPEPDILKRLVKLGSNFDTASIFEIEQCLAAGALPEQISFGNTIKKNRDIIRAYQLGIRLFSFDSLGELEKLAVHAPGSKVYCRLLIETKGALWPLARKFGCAPEMAFDLMMQSQQLGLEPYGLSFHVGSQQMDPTQWDAPIGVAKELFSLLAQNGIKLKMLNLGGGFPARYQSSILKENIYGGEILAALHRHFGNLQPLLMVEPGRSLVAEAGIIQAEVILISKKFYTQDVRWVYLDIGKFNGLSETVDEPIQYKIRTSYDEGTPTSPVILAGPTCDSADILYEKTKYKLPIDLKVGDRIEIYSTGAYTHTYSSVGFNGFPPLKVYCI
jgi:ornithine decarboxylase